MRLYSIGTIIPLPLGLYSTGSINHVFSIEAMFKHWTYCKCPTIAFHIAYGIFGSNH